MTYNTRNTLAKIEEFIAAKSEVSLRSFIVTSSSEYNRFLAAFNDVLVEQHHMLYLWKNGQSFESVYDGVTLPLFRRYFFLPLAVSLERGALLNSSAYSSGFWAPILDDYAGDCYFVDLSESATQGQIGFHSMTRDHIIKHEWVYLSIDNLLLDVLEYWKNGPDL
jgi:hypothetical protein